MAVKDWSPAAMARFIVISVSINFASLVMLMLIAANNINNIEDVVDKANANTRKIAVNAYNQCVEANKAEVARNASIESTIASERRDAKPDLKRIQDLETIRTIVRQCGDDPRTEVP